MKKKKMKVIMKMKDKLLLKNEIQLKNFIFLFYSRLFRILFINLIFIFIHINFDVFQKKYYLK